MRAKNSPILLYLRTCPPALVQLSRAEMEVVLSTFLLRPPPLTSGLEGRVPREVKVREAAGIKVRKFVVVLFDKRLSSKHRGEREEAPCLSPLTTPAGVAYFAHVRRSREVSVSLFPPPPPRLFLGNGFPPPFSCKSSASPPPSYFTLLHLTSFGIHIPLPHGAFSSGTGEETGDTIFAISAVAHFHFGVFCRIGAFDYPARRRQREECWNVPTILFIGKVKKRRSMSSNSNV